MALTLKLARYLIGSKIRGLRKFPLTMILEPLEKCNLACQGCGRIREYAPVIDRMMTAQECLAAVEECAAPVVSMAVPRGSMPATRKTVRQSILL